MTTMPCPLPTSPLWRAALLIAALAASASSHALYKVVGPDGKVTYTDRAPTSSEGKASPLGNAPAPVTADVPLPVELRQVVSRYPVTLYTTTGTCEPCDAGRSLLRTRGIPFSEKQVSSAEDGEALQRLSGGRDAPTLAIGSQTLRGLAADTWNGYLDSAGYPRESKLPAGYQPPPVTPLTARREAASAAADPAAAPAPATARTPAPVAAPAPGQIRF